jgi:hypothetical protein
LAAPQLCPVLRNFATIAPRRAHRDRRRPTQIRSASPANQVRKAHAAASIAVSTSASLESVTSAITALRARPMIDDGGERVRDRS